MRTDIHFICETCTADYLADPAAATACEARHLQQATAVIVKRFDYENQLNYRFTEGRPRRILVQWTDSEGRSWTQQYEAQQGSEFTYYPQKQSKE